MNTKPLWMLALVLACASAVRAEDVAGGEEAAGLIKQAKSAIAPAAPDNIITRITKKPLERLEKGPILVYRYRISGAAKDYRWIIVQSEESKRMVVGLLEAVGVVSESGSTWVRTLQESIDSMQGSEQPARVAKLRADLQNHSVIVESYENDPPKR